MEVRNSELFLGGVPASLLAEEFSTPLYVYEEDTMRTRARELLGAISYGNKEIKFACKANTNIEIMKIFREEGMGIDAVSPGELYAALRAGFDPSQILLTANNATWEEIEYAISRNVTVNIDSLSQLRLFGQRHPGTDVCVRINPNVGAGHHNHCITGGPDSKFGIEYREVDEIRRVAKQHTLRVKGVHQHIGSGILQPDIFIEAMDILLAVARAFDDLTFIDFGGGIGVPYREGEERIDVGELGRKIGEDFARFCREYGRELKLVIEPGRYLVAESGFLLAEVTAVKEGSKHRFIGINSGFNHLIRPAMYGSYHPILNATNLGGKPVLQTVAGNLCESGDTFTRDEQGIVDRELPLFREGDVVCICNAGAYGYSMASYYNSRPRPAEVIVRDGKARLVRRKESIEELFRNCVSRD